LRGESFSGRGRRFWRREPVSGVQDLIVAHCEEIYKLKGEMRKRDQSIDELQKRMDFTLKTIYEFKDRSERKFESEINKLKRLKET
jgi:hypothetical protein